MEHHAELSGRKTEDGTADRNRKNDLRFLLLVTLITAIAYGISIPKLSFYGDDWIYVYNYHLAGAKSFTLFTQSDRPYSAWIYVLTSALFGESPLGYHLYVLVMRWLSVILFRKVLINSFGNSRTVDTAALLFAVYPGFQQQPVAVEFVMHFTSLVLALLSIRLSQAAFFMPRIRRLPVIVISLAAGLAAIFTCEYFIGLELTRPLFLYYAIRRNSGEETRYQTKDFLKYLIPYGFVTAFFFIWRIFIFSFRTYQPKLLNALQEDPVRGVLTLCKKVFADLWTVFFKAYRLTFARPSVPLKTALMILLPAAVAGLLFFILNRHEEDETPERHMLLLGIVLTLLSGIPFWGTFLDVTVTFPWDRSTLSFSPGAAVIIAVLMHMALKPAFFCAAAAAITALCTLFQYQNAQVYIREAGKMNDYFWQLSWRAPGLEKGTILASDEIPLDRYSDNDISPVVNWQYAPNHRGLSYDYKYFDLDLREETYYSNPGKAVPVDHTYRTHAFSSSTQKTLGIYYQKNGCLNIVDMQTRSYPGLPGSLKRIAKMSDPGLIITDPGDSAVPPLSIGPEPEHGYCYYFQKASLALQTGDKDAAYGLAQEALRSGLTPVYAPDLAPLLVAFIEAGDFESAEAMISRNEISPSDREYLCSYLQHGLPESDLSANIAGLCGE